MPMPMRKGSANSPRSAALRSARCSDISRAAASASRQAESPSRSMPKSAMTPSPMNLSSRPPACSIARHIAEIAVQDEHDVVGQPPLGERGEAADIGEQDGDLTLAALREIHPPRTIGGVREMRQ